MTTQSSRVVKPLPGQFVGLYHSIRTHMLHAAANSEEGTARARLAYVALWLLASASAVANATHFSALFAGNGTDEIF